MEQPVSLKVEITYAANAVDQRVIPIDVSPGCTVQEAILFSGILTQFPEIDLNKRQIGIFSKPATLETVLQMGDRVEIYRPLAMDPKVARSLRAKKRK